MAANDHKVVVVGGGAAGIGAAKALQSSGIPVVIVEARSRLGGRAWTRWDLGTYPIDYGCGWLHSADRNPWTEIAIGQGCTLDKTPPPWGRPSPAASFPMADQQQFWGALREFYGRLYAAADEPDSPADRLLVRGGKWNAIINAVSTFMNGAELDRVSTQDFASYDDTGINWRVADGYGTVITRHAVGIEVMLDTVVRQIDWRGKRIEIETSKGKLTAAAVIVTLPSNLIAEEAIRFLPALPDKVNAAAGLPLGLADKLFIEIAEPAAFEEESRAFGRTDTVATGAYHFRPFGRPMIEGYFGGRLAADLEAGGEKAFADFALEELSGVFGGGIRGKVKVIGGSAWRADPFAHGSYSYAKPGHAGDRARLAAPVDNRIFFAGEACSPGDFSTAHGAYLTGLSAGAAAYDALAHAQRQAV